MNSELTRIHERAAAPKKAAALERRGCAAVPFGRHASDLPGNKSVPARPDETTDRFYSVGGLTSGRDPNKDVHLRWKASLL